MTVTIINKTNSNVDIWLNIVGPKYWDNNVAPEGICVHHPGGVCYDVKVKRHTSEKEEITAGMAAIQGALPFWGIVVGPIYKTLIATDAIRNSDLISKDVKKYLDSDSIVIDDGSDFGPCEYTNVWGWYDKTFEIRGGQITYTTVDGKCKAHFGSYEIVKTVG